VTSDRPCTISVLARRLAAIVSWVCHPLVFVTASVGVVVRTQLASRLATTILEALFLSVILPTGVLLFLGVRSGRWSDVDISVREERRRFYPIAVPLSGLGTFFTWWLGAPRYILRGGIVTLLLLVVAAFTNFWFKISLHTLFASYCTAILFRVNAVWGTASLALAVLVFWSRLFLKRHTFLETIGGVALGVVGGMVTAWMSI
jgi:membrane-associated phospholipid phosphatase